MYSFSINTYNKLDKYLLELMQKRGDRHISLDKAINSLIEDHYLKKARKADSSQHQFLKIATIKSDYL